MDKAIHEAFAEAIENGDEAAARRLLLMHPDLVDGPNWTPPPLHCAVLWDQPEMAKLLLDHSADIEIRDPDRNTTPLRYAVLYASEACLKLLVDRGARTGPISDDGSTALELAEEAAAGAYEQYEDMPPREAYQAILAILKSNA